MKYFRFLTMILSIVIISCSSSDYTFKIKYITRDSLKQPGSVKVYDCAKNEKYTIKEDYWDKVSALFCGEIETTPVDRKRYWPEDYIFATTNMNMELTSNTIINDIFKKYKNGELPDHNIYGSCNQNAGITSFKIPISKQLENSIKIVTYIVCYAIYNTNNDSVYFVDSIFVDENYGSSSGYIDSSGAYFYYSKRAFALRYDIHNNTIDTIFQGGTPMIPVNSDDIIVYSEQDHKLRLLNDELKVIKSIRLEYFYPISVYKVDKFKYLIGKHYSKPLYINKNTFMEVSLYDFEKETVTELFIDDYGEIIGVVK